MKNTVKLKWAIACAGLLVAGSTFGQRGYGGYDGPPVPMNQHSKAQDTASFFHARDIVGVTVNDSSGEKVGKIHDVLVSPRTGETFAAISIGDDRWALVPAEKLNISPAYGWFEKTRVSINATKDEVQSGPSVKATEWQKLDEPAFTRDIYQHYHLRLPTVSQNSVTGNGAKS